MRKRISIQIGATHFELHRQQIDVAKSTDSFLNIFTQDNIGIFLYVTMIEGKDIRLSTSYESKMFSTLWHPIFIMIIWDLVNIFHHPKTDSSWKNEISIPVTYHLNLQIKEKKPDQLVKPNSPPSGRIVYRARRLRNGPTCLYRRVTR